MLALPLTWGYTQNFKSPNGMQTLFNFFESLLLSKGGGLSTKAVCWSWFWKCDQQKVLQHKASVNCMIVIVTFSCTAVQSICWLVMPHINLSLLRRIAGKPDKTLNKIIVLKPVGRAPFNLSGKHAIGWLIFFPTFLENSACCVIVQAWTFKY